jgi:hypothetical protein
LFDAARESFERERYDLAIVLTCDLLEILLEMFFRDFFMKQGKPPSWIQWMLRKNRSLDIRLRYLFKETMNRRLSSIVRGTPFEGFEKRWAMVRSNRGVLVQRGLTVVDRDTGREALEVSRQGMALFAWLTNRYCV